MKAIIYSAQRICSRMYNSNSLHSMMREANGGELVKWNATSFETNYTFLESFMQRMAIDHSTSPSSYDILVGQATKQS
jgi:hypothetical protein